MGWSCCGLLEVGGAARATDGVNAVVVASECNLEGLGHGLASQGNESNRGVRLHLWIIAKQDDLKVKTRQTAFLIRIQLSLYTFHSTLLIKIK
jgi:hypothetical protein